MVETKAKFLTVNNIMNYTFSFFAGLLGSMVVVISLGQWNDKIVASFFIAQMVLGYFYGMIACLIIFFIITRFKK